MGRTTSQTTGRAMHQAAKTMPCVEQQGRAMHQVAWQRYTSGRWAALSVGQPSCTTRRAAGPAARRTNYSATAPLDLQKRSDQRTDDADTYTMGIEAPRPWSLQQDSITIRWDSVVIRSGIGHYLLESTTHGDPCLQ